MAYKAAVIGCGGRGPAHIEAYQHIDNAEVVACCDLLTEQADKRATAYGIKAYTDAAGMIRAERPDIVHVVFPPGDTRVAVMQQIAELGVPMCTTEKPLAIGVADWRELAELEATSQTKFAVCHQFRWQVHLAKCRQALASGRLGEVKFLDFSAGMNISGQGTHILNYGMSLNGDCPVVRVFGAANGASDDTVHPAPQSTAGYLTFANGVRALWNNGPTALRIGDPKTAWQHVRVAAYADRGRTNYEEFGRWEIVGPDGVECGDCGGMGTWQKNNALAQAGLHKALIEWHETGQPAACGTNLAQGLHEWAVVLALYQSALERRPIEMAGFDPPEDLFDRLMEALS